MQFLMGASAAMLLAAFFGIVFNSLLLLVLHFLMPREVLLRYWREPYFRPAELALFTGTMFAPMRTVMLSWVISFPNLGKKRQIDGVYELVSTPYKAAATAFCGLAVICVMLVAIGVVGVTVDLWLTGEESLRRTQITASLLVSLGCFVGVGVYQWYVRRREAKPGNKRRRRLAARQ